MDPKLGSEFDKAEAEKMIRVALLCSNASPSIRPIMSEVVSMLEGKTAIPDTIPEAGSFSEDLRFKTLREHQREANSSSLEGSQAQNSSSMSLWPGSSSTSDAYQINAQTYLKFKSMRDSQIHMERQSSLAQVSTSGSKSAHDTHVAI